MLIRSKRIPRQETWRLKRRTPGCSHHFDYCYWIKKVCLVLWILPKMWTCLETVWRCYMLGLLALLATNIPSAWGLHQAAMLDLFRLIRAKWGCDSFLRSCFPWEKPLLLISQHLCVLYPDRSLAALALAQNRLQYILHLLLVATFQYTVSCQSPRWSSYIYPHLFLSPH